MLEIKTPRSHLILKEFSINSTYVNPNNTGAFEQGEWWQLDTNNSESIVPITTGNPFLAYPIWTKKGAYAAQSLNQVTVVYGGPLESDTDQFDSTATFTIGQQLMIENGVLTPVAGGNYVHAVVIIPPDSNSNKLRFRTYRI